MSEIKRVSPEEVREKIQKGNALLVCAYKDDWKCDKMRLDGSIVLSEFIAGVSEILKEREIIFF